MDKNLTDIIYFLETLNTKNISRAAERLGITQPSLSSAIKRLEDAFGVVLLIRSRSGVQPTQAGLRLQASGRALILNYEQMRTDIHKAQNGICGKYSIGCHPSVALYSLSHFLPELMQQHSELEIRLIHDLSRKITERVISFEVDFGIVVNPVRHPDLVIKDLCSDDVLFWTAERASKTQSLSSDDGVLICDPNLLQTQKLLNDLRSRCYSFKRIIESSDLEVVTELTAAGVGIGIIPNRVAMRANAKKLKPLKDDLPIFKDKICLIYRAESQKSLSSRLIIDSIRSQIK